MPDRVIDIRQLSKRFGTKVAISDLSLSIGPGEIFGFLGPNGAGKTTAIKMLLGLIEPDGGSATVLGAPIGDRQARAGIGFLPEHFRFHDCLTGRELVRFHGRLYGLRGPRLEARIEALLARVDLMDVSDQLLRTYSKGMLQRVGLAQALVNAPALVFLDEPTSGLDPLGRLLVRDVIKELRARGATVFLNSHLLGEVEATCDRVVFVKQGRSVGELSLVKSPVDIDIELRLSDSGPAIVDGLGRFGTNASRVDGGVRMRVGSEQSLPQIVQWLVEQGVGVYGLQSRRRSLEELFLDIMGDDQRAG